MLCFLLCDCTYFYEIMEVEVVLKKNEYVELGKL